jgi:protein O-mannosyl-transferase
MAKTKRGKAPPTAKSKNLEPQRPSEHKKLWLIAGILVVINVMAYFPVSTYGFVNYDDATYISNNPDVTRGLTFDGLVWAFTTGRASNWHPVTWLSHMTDVQLFGVNAGAHHVVNLVLHIANTLLLFWFFQRATGQLGPSAFVAALFAVHPLHVESVVWLAERKDLLSTLFWTVALCAYVSYVRNPRFSAYLAVFVALALGLMAKPMLVTMPFLMLLLDYWPLQRLRLSADSNLLTLVREKVPFFILVAASSIVTFLVQKAGGAMGTPGPLANRIANAFVGYLTYVWKAIWPVNLAVLYPLHDAPIWWPAAVLALVGLSILSIWLGRNRPYIPVGWFWYIGTLVPVIGVVQVGRQAIADRYTYVPLIGLFLIVAFARAEYVCINRSRRLAAAGVGALLIILCMWGTRAQLQYWQTSEALWTHTLNVTRDNSLAHNDLGTALEQSGKVDEALLHYAEATRIEPEYASAHFNLAAALLKSGKTNRANEASVHLTEALRIQPDFAEAHNTLGVYLLNQGKGEEAIRHLREAVRLKPDFPLAHNNLAGAFATVGRIDEAIAEYGEALRWDPTFLQASDNLGILLMQRGKTSEAIGRFRESLRINPRDSAALRWLANLKAQ